MPYNGGMRCCSLYGRKNIPEGGNTMKHKATKRILSLLLAMVMLVGLLPTAAIPVFAVEESDIYAEDPDYEHGYF